MEIERILNWILEKELLVGEMMHVGMAPSDIKEAFPAIKTFEYSSDEAEKSENGEVEQFILEINRFRQVETDRLHVAIVIDPVFHIISNSVNVN